MINGVEDLNRIWQKVCAKFSFTFGVAAFNSWVKPLEFNGFDARTAIVAAPSRFVKDWVSANYGRQLEEMLKAELPDLLNLEINVGSKTNFTANNLHVEALSQRANENKFFGKADEFASVLDQRFKFENFVAGNSNKLAHAAALSIAEGKPLGSNTFMIVGAVGSGKTHLLQSIAHSIKENHPQKKALYLSAEKFMFQFVKAIREKDTVTFKEVMRATDILLIDDIQFICGKQHIQEEFIHTFNAIIENGKQIVLSADRHPNDFTGIDERIKSRLGWGLVADIQKPDAELRLNILKSKAKLLNEDVNETVLEFLANNINTNIRELEGAFIKIVAQSRLFGANITVDFAVETLKDLLRGVRKELTIDEIKRTVCSQFEIKLADIESAKRDRAIARPRQVAMYLAKNLTTKSLPEIGRNFGSKNHTTVIHAIKTIEKLKDAEPEMNQQIHMLTRKLAG